VAKAKYYPWFDAMVTVKTIRELKYPTVSVKWITVRLRRGYSVQMLLDEHVLTPSQRASKGAKQSEWGKKSFLNEMTRKQAEAERLERVRKYNEESSK